MSDCYFRTDDGYFLIIGGLTWHARWETPTK